MSEYEAKQGDCVLSIAMDHGHFWERIWNDPNNQSLVEAREHPAIIHPKDKVHIPEKTKRVEPGATEQRHRFRRKGVPEKICLRLLKQGQPRGNERYRLTIDGELFSGETDADGFLEHPIPPNAVRGRLFVGDDEDEYELDLGYLDPIDQPSGVQARLNNLGFDCGSVDGDPGERTAAAIKEFQDEHGLESTGSIDTRTREMLLESHGS